jgi:hypothetical protein
MEIQVYFCEDFQSEESIIYKIKAEINTHKKIGDSTLKKLYQEGWKIKTVSRSLRSLHFFMEREFPATE